MKKSYKIAYIALIALCAILCVMDIVVGNYWAAILMGTTAVYLLVFYWQVQLNARMLIDLTKYYTAYCESLQREGIAKEELNKMRKREEIAKRNEATACKSLDNTRSELMRTISDLEAMTKRWEMTEDARQKLEDAYQELLMPKSRQAKSKNVK